MTFKVTYNARNHTWENGKYIDNDNYTISIKDINMNVNEYELDELVEQIKKAIWDRNDFRGYHE